MRPMFTNFFGEANFKVIFQSASLLTVSKAFVRSTKVMKSPLFCSRLFSCNCLTVKILSILPRPFLKLHWDSGRRLGCTFGESSLRHTQEISEVCGGLLLLGSFLWFLGEAFPYGCLNSSRCPHFCTDAWCMDSLWSSSLLHINWNSSGILSVRMGPPLANSSAGTTPKSGPCHLRCLNLKWLYSPHLALIRRQGTCWSPPRRLMGS